MRKSIITTGIVFPLMAKDVEYGSNRYVKTIMPYFLVVEQLSTDVPAIRQ